jgi:hypothetical protein
VVENKDTGLVELAVLIRLNTRVFPQVEDVADHPRHLGSTLPDARLDAIDNHVLHLRMSPIERTEVAAPPRVVDRTGEVQFSDIARAVSRRLRSRRERLASAKAGQCVAFVDHG